MGSVEGKVAIQKTGSVTTQLLPLSWTKPCSQMSFGRTWWWRKGRMKLGPMMGQSSLP